MAAPVSIRQQQRSFLRSRHEFVPSRCWLHRPYVLVVTPALPVQLTAAS